MEFISKTVKVALAAFMLLLAGAAHADPVTLGVMVVGALASAGQIAGWYAVAAVFAGAVYQGAQARKAAKKAASQAKQEALSALRERNQSYLSGEPPLYTIYGEPAPVGGVPVATFNSGWRDELKHVVMVFASHPCEALLEVLINGEPSGTIGVDGWIIDGKWAGIVTDTPYEAVVTFDESGVAYVPDILADTALASKASAFFGEPAIYDSELTLEKQPTFGRTKLTSTRFHGETARITGTYTSADSKLRIGVHTDGAAVADYYLKAQLPGIWTDQHTLTGMTYLVVTFKMDQEEFQNNMPAVTARFKGKRIYDPRINQVVYSRNVALQLNDHLTSPTGFGMAREAIDQTALIAAANQCDEAFFDPVDNMRFNLANSLARYVGDGRFDTSMDRDAIRDSLEDAMAGTSYDSAGVVVIRAGAWTAPVLSLTDDDFLAPAQILQAAPTGNERFNSMRAQYINADGKGTIQDSVPYENAALIALDGVQRWGDASLVLTAGSLRAVQISRVMTEMSRGGLTIAITPRMLYWKLRPGDRINITTALYGMVNKPFRVTEWVQSPGKPLQLACIEDSALFYDRADLTQEDPAPNTSLPDAFSRPAPMVNLAAESGPDQMLVTGQSVTPRVKITFLASENIYVTNGGHSEIEWRLATVEDDFKSIVLGGGATETYLSTVPVNAIILIRGRYVTSLGAASEWVTINHLVTGLPEQMAPGSNFTAAITPAGIIGTWDSPEGIYGAAWFESQVRVGTNWADGSILWTGRAVSANLGWLVSGNRNLMLAHRKIDSDWSTAVNFGIAIRNPSDPIVTAGIGYGTGTASWTSGFTDQPIAYYDVRRGPLSSSFATAVPMENTQLTNALFSEPEMTVVRYYVQAVDMAGNKSGVGQAQVDVAGTGVPSGTALPALGKEGAYFFLKGATGDTLYAWNVAQNRWAPIGTPSGSALPAVAASGEGDTFLLNGVLYRFTAGAWGIATVGIAQFASGLSPVLIASSVPAVKIADVVSVNGVMYTWDVATNAYKTTVAAVAPGSIDETMLASSLEVPLNYNGVPATRQASDVIFNTANFKLYRWNGTAYVTTVPTTDLSGTVSSAQIANLAITTAKMATGLEPVTIVSGTTVPTTKSTNVITVNNELYRWDTTTSTYVKSVKTTDLTGTVTDAQIAQVAASKLQGQIADAQIAAMAASKITGVIAAANLSLGGSNMFANSGFEDAGTGRSPEWSSGSSSTANIVWTKTANITPYGTKAQRATFDLTAAGYIDIRQIVTMPVSGVALAIQVKMRASVAGNVTIYCQMRTGSTVVTTPSSTTALAASTTAFSEITLVVPASANTTAIDNVYVYYRFTPTAVATGIIVDWDEAQIEEGVVPTGYAPKPGEILDAQVTDAKIAALAASKITGQIVNSQLSAIDAAKITGALADAQIAAVSASKIAGQVTNTQIASVDGSKVTGALANAQIAAGNVTGQLTSAQVASLAADKITGALVDAQLASISAAKIAGSILNTQIDSVDATKLTGQLADAQVAAIAASKITGIIVDSQLGTIAASKVAGQLADTQIAAVAASKITGTIVNTQIDTVAATKLTGQLADTQIAAVAASKITGTIADTQISAVSASKIAGAILDGQLAAISASKITGTVADTQIAGMSATKLVGTVASSQIASLDVAKLTGTIPAANLNVGGSNMLNNSGFEDPSTTTAAGWNVGSSGTSAVTTSKVTKNSPYGSKAQRLLFNLTSAGGYVDLSQGISVNSYGVPLAIQAKLRASVAGTWVMYIQYKTGATVVSTSSNANTAIAASTTAFTEISYVAPASSFTSAIDGLSVFFRFFPNAVANNITVDWDEVQLEEGAVPTGYAPKPGELLDSQVTSTVIADNAITTAKVAANAIVAGKIAADAIAASNIQAGAVVAGKLAADSVSTSNLQANSITAAKIAAGEITAGKLAANAVTAGNIAANAVTAGTIAANVIGTNELAAGAITAKHLQVADFENLVANPSGANGIDGWNASASNLVVSSGWNSGWWGALGSGTDTAYTTRVRDVLSNYIIPAKAGDQFYVRVLSVPQGGASSPYDFVVGFAAYDLAGNVIQWGGLGVRPASAVAGQITEGSGMCVGGTAYIRVWFSVQGPNPDIYNNNNGFHFTDLELRRKNTGKLIVDGAISANLVAANAIAAGNIQAGAITSGKIAAGVVTATEIAAGTITSDRIASRTIAADRIQAGAITAAEIAANTITAAKIAANTITAAQIAAGTITATEIGAGAITAEKLTVTALLGDNLILNSQMTEARPDGTPVQWLAKHTSNQAYTLATENGGTGESAKVMTLARTASNGFVFVASQAVPVVPNTTYVVRFKYSNVGGATSMTVQDGLSPAQPADGYNGFPVTTGGTLGSNLSQTTAVAANAAVADFVATFTVPSGQRWFSLCIYSSGTWTSNTFLRISDVHVETQVLATQIKDGAIITAKIAAGAITANELAANAVTAAKIAANTITASQIASGTITATQIATGTITATQIASRTITADRIVTGAITANEIAANTITAAKIAANTITASQIASGTITATQIAAGTITSDRIASRTIAADRIQAGAITATEIAANAITASQIAAGAVTAGKIAAGSISATELAAGSVGAAQLAVVSQGENLVFNGSFEEGVGASLGWKDKHSQSVNPVWNTFAGNSARDGSRFLSSYRNVDTDKACLVSQAFPIEPGATYKISMWLCSYQGNVRAILYSGQSAARPADGFNGYPDSQYWDALPNSIQDFVGPASTPWRYYEEVVTTRADCRWMSIGIHNWDGLAWIGTAELYVDNVIVRRQITSAVIQDGAITTPKVVAGAITADKIKIQSNGISLNTDPTFQEELGSSWKAGAGSSINVGFLQSIGDAPSGRRVWTANTASRVESLPFPIEAGKTYVVSAWWRTFGGAQGVAYLRVHRMQGATDLAYVTNFEGVLPVNDSAWRQHVFTFVAEAGTTWAWMDAHMSWTYEGAASGQWQLADFKVQQVMDGTLIQDGVITTVKVAANAITATQIAANAITSGKIAAGVVTANEIASATITGAKIAATTITAGNIAANTITAAQIAAGTITATQIATRTITADRIVTGAITANEIAANTITAAKIAANTITASQILSGTITTTQIASGTITAGNIATGTITATQIASRTITADRIVAGAITANEIAASTITAAKIAANTITAAQIAAGTITAVEIAAGAITAEKLTITAQLADNLILNSQMTEVKADGTPSRWLAKHSSNQAYTWGVEDGSTGEGAKVMTLGRTASNGFLFVCSAAVPVVPNTTYVIRFKYRASNAGTTMTVQDGLSPAQPADGYNGFPLASGGSLGASISSSVAVAASANAADFVGTFTVPDGQKWFSLCIYTGGSWTAASYLRISDVHVEPQVVSTQIKDGSIITAKIAANAVTATQIAANSITSDAIAANSITAGKIAAGAVQADALQIGSGFMRKFQVRGWGTGSGVNADGGYWFNGTKTYNSGTRGLNVLGISRTAPYSVVHANTYDTYGSATAAQTCADVLNGFSSSVIVMITSADANGVSLYPNLIAAMKKCGASTAVEKLDYRQPYVLVGYGQMGEGNGLEVMLANAAGVVAELTVLQVDGDIIGLNGSVKEFANIGTTKIADGAIVTNKIAALAVTASQIAANTITAAKIASSTITATQLASNSITSVKIAANAVTAGKIATDAVTAGTVAAGAISARELSANAVTAEKLNVRTQEPSLLANGSFEDGWYGWSTTSHGEAVGPVDWVNGGVDGTKCVWIGRGVSTDQTCIISRSFPVTPGETYAVRFKYYVNGARANFLPYVFQHPNPGANGGIDGQFYIPYPGAAYTDQFPGGGIKDAGGWYQFEAVFIARADCYYASIVVHNWGGIWEGATYIHLDMASVQRQIGSVTIKDGVITAAKIAANAVTADKVAANSISAANIQVGAVGADQIAARAITAYKLAITPDLTNLVNNGGESAEGWSWGVSLGAVNDNGWLNTWWAPIGVNSKAMLTNVARDSFFGTAFNIKPGDSFHAELPSVVFGGGASLCQQALGLAVMDAAGTVVGWIAIAVRPIGTTGAYLAKGEWTCNLPTAATALVWMQINADPSVTGNAGYGFHFVKPIVRRMTEGELIVDGAITTAKLTANAVSADKIQAGAITTGKIQAGAITSEKIAAGAITADKANFATLSSLTSNLGYMTGAALDITGGEGGPENWGYVRSSGKWFGTSAWGWVLARRNTDGAVGLEFIGNNMGLRMYSWTSTSQFWGQGFYLDNGSLTISQLNVIDSFNVKSKSIVQCKVGTGNGSALVQFDVPAGETWQFSCIASTTGGRTLSTGTHYIHVDLNSGVDNSLITSAGPELPVTIVGIGDTESGSPSEYRRIGLPGAFQRELLLGPGSYNFWGTSLVGTVTLTVIVAKRP